MKSILAVIGLSFLIIFSAFTQITTRVSAQVEAPPFRGEASVEPYAVSGFDWRWLLPIVAVPILYLLWRIADEDQSQTSQMAFAGVKGGSAKKTRFNKTKTTKKRVKTKRS